MVYKHGAKKLTLVDSSKEALKLANKLFQGIDIVEFVNADILERDHKMKYDIILSSGVVERFQGENLLKLY
jgi:23S rRNA G2069 N7-methylase RlmK/C1962 C5-methylase RlmI